MKHTFKLINVLVLILLVAVLCATIYFFGKTGNKPVSEEPPLVRSTEDVRSPEDGQGKAVVIPDNDVVISSPNTWKVIFTVAETGIAKGGGVAFHISPFWGWTPPQDYSPNRPGYTTVTCSKQDVDLEIDMNQDLNYVAVRIPNRELAAGDTITMIYGDTQGGKNPGAVSRADKFAEQRERFFIKVDGNGDGHFFGIDTNPAINILHASARHLIVNAPSMVEQDVPFTIEVACVDHMGNWVPFCDTDVTMLSLPAEGPVVTETPGDDRIKSFTCTVPRQGLYRFIADDAENELSGISNPVVCKKELPALKVFWGDLHGHSQLSDGTGTPEDYFQYARFVSGLDAVALTDHDFWGFEPLAEHEDIWSSIKDTTNRFYEPGTFVTLIGYEWTSWTYGHKHVLFRDEPAPIFSFHDPESDSPDKLWKLLEDYNAMTISHHSGGGPIATDWSFYHPEMEPVVEICSVHGNSECMECPLCIYSAKEGSFVRDALARGYKLGIVASGDTHNGHPGMGDPEAPTGGIMAFYARELTREALWEAIHKKRVYGTTGDRIILEFSINNHFMGETVKQDTNTEREIAVKVWGADRLNRVEIIKNNESLMSWKEENAWCEHTVKEQPDNAKMDFYYLRVIQENGQMAWSSPIWFEVF